MLRIKLSNKSMIATLFVCVLSSNSLATESLDGLMECTVKDSLVIGTKDGKPYSFRPIGSLSFNPNEKLRFSYSLDHNNKDYLDFKAILDGRDFAVNFHGLNKHSAFNGFYWNNESDYIKLTRDLLYFVNNGFEYTFKRYYKSDWEGIGIHSSGPLKLLNSTTYIFDCRTVLDAVDEIVELHDKIVRNRVFKDQPKD